jgi:putative transposase
MATCKIKETKGMVVMGRTRKKYSGKFKLQVVLETIAGERTTAEIARNYDVSPNLIGKWKQELIDRGHEIFETPTADNNPYKKIEELEKIIGKLTVELELAKNYLRHYSCRS